jgi:hypothetical protein
MALWKRFSSFAALTALLALMGCGDISSTEGQTPTLNDANSAYSVEGNALGSPVPDELALPGNVRLYSDSGRGGIVIYSGRHEAEVVNQSQQAPATTVNTKVLDFARRRLGQQVGRGECWDLAYQALSTAGAKLPGTEGYGWIQFGLAVTTAIPGDIIQFENVKFVYANGSSNTMTKHTAIVEQVSGTVIELIHQNSNGIRSPTRGTIDLKAKTQGTVTIYRPQPR